MSAIAWKVSAIAWKGSAMEGRCPPYGGGVRHGGGGGGRKCQVSAIGGDVCQGGICPP